MSKDELNEIAKQLNNNKEDLFYLLNQLDADDIDNWAIEENLVLGNV